LVRGEKEDEKDEEKKKTRKTKKAVGWLKESLPALEGTRGD